MSGSGERDDDTPNSVTPERSGISWKTIAIIFIIGAFVLAALFLMRQPRPSVVPTTAMPAAPPSMGQRWQATFQQPPPDLDEPTEAAPAMTGNGASGAPARARLSRTATWTRATVPGQPAPAAARAIGASDREAEAPKLAGMEVLRADYISDASRYLMPGDTIQCRNTQPLTERGGAAFSVLLPEGARGQDGQTVIVPKGSRAFGKVVSGMQHGERRMAALLTHIQGPHVPGRPTMFVPIGDGQAGDPLGGVDLEGNVETHFASRLGAVAAYAALDMVARTGSAVAGGAINDAVNGGRGQTNVNVGNFGGMGSGRGLAGQAFDHEIQRKPSFDRPQAQGCTIFIQQPIHIPR